MIRLSFFFVLFIMSGCLNLETSCCDYINTIKIDDKLYLEKYRTFCAGVFGERMDYFLTDSIEFRKLIGSTDEHSHLIVSRNGDSIHSILFEDIIQTDTTGIKKLSLLNLKEKYSLDTNFMKDKPLFGKNILECNNHIDYNSITESNGFYTSELQFHCGNNYINGVYFTDSLHFRILIGLYEPGNDPNYIVLSKDPDSVVFIRTKANLNFDTISNKLFDLRKLKKGKLINVCKGN